MEDRAIVALYWKRAETLSAFLAKITRNLSLDRYDAKHAEKRGGGLPRAAHRGTAVSSIPCRDRTKRRCHADR